MSALMILLLVFLTLTLDEFLYKDSYRESSKFDTVELNSNQSSFSAIFGFFIFIPVFFYLSVDFLYCIQESSQISHLFYNDTNGNLAVLSAESAYSDIMHTISIDISSSFMEYLLSGLLQSVCLISVIALIIFK